LKGLGDNEYEHLDDKKVKFDNEESSESESDDNDNKKGEISSGDEKESKV